MQSSRQKGKGWFVNDYDVIYVQGTVDGKFYRKSTDKKANTANIKWIAKNARDVLLKLIEHKDKNAPVTINNFALDVLELTKHKRSERTQKEYINQYAKNVAPFFKNYNIDDVTAIDIEKWQNSLRINKLSSATIKRLRTILSIAFEKAVGSDIIAKNPIKYAESIKVVHQKREPYTEAEMRLLISTAEGWLKVFLIVAFSTGLRTGELIGLQWNDVNLKDGFIDLRRAISKGSIVDETCTTNTSKNHQRVVELIPDVVDMLAKFYKIRPNKTWLFVTKDDEHYSDTKGVAKKFKTLLKACGVKDKTLYATRHTFTSMMLNSGFDKTWVKEMLGHTTDSNITDKHYFEYARNQTRVDAVNDFFKFEGLRNAFTKIVGK